MYVYQNSPRIVTINPLQRVVLYAAELAAYSFTAVVVNALNTAVNVAVGSFFGGGFIPAVGVPLPPPPPPVWRYDNVPVQVRSAVRPSPVRERISRYAARTTSTASADAAAVACSVLSLGAVGLVVLMGRRRGM